jgi:RNA polymerase sigma factor (TIGR02999 family)
VEDEITQGLNASVPELPSALYGSLRRLAQHHLSRQRGAPTLNATALVNEAWLKLAAGDPQWQSRQHFLAAMARVMRHVLIDYARERQAERRGGDQQQITYEGLDLADDERFEVSDLVAIDQALQRLGEFDPRLVQVFELRFFAGLTIEETAAALALSTPTVKRDLRAARAFVTAQLDGSA